MAEPDRSPDRRSSDRRPPHAGQNLVNIAIGAVLVGMLGYAGSIISEYTRRVDGFATKESLSDLRALIVTHPTRAEFDQLRREVEAIDKAVLVIRTAGAKDEPALERRLQTIERDVEWLRRVIRAPGTYPSPN